MSKEIEVMIDNLKQAYNSNYEMSEHLSDTEFNNIIKALTEYEAIKNAIEICKKANEQKYVWIKESWGCCKEKFLDDLDYEVLKNRLYVNSRGIYYSFNLNEYGIYWALTKEELE